MSISLNQTTLTPQDLLLATDYLILVSKGLREVDDIDHLKNRRVRTSGELIQLQIGIGLVRLEKNIREKMNKIQSQLFYKIPTRAPVTPSLAQVGPSLFFTHTLKGYPRGVTAYPWSFPTGRKGVRPSLVFPSPFVFTHTLSSPLVLPVGKERGIPKVRTRAYAYPQRGEVKKNEGRGRHKPLGERKKYPFPSLVGTVLQSQREGPGVSKVSNNTVSINNGNTNYQPRTKNSIEYIEKLTISTIMNTKPFNGALKEFFGSSPLSQFMDQINPLAELTHKRRLSSMGPGGVTRDSATLEIRGIHPSHYGRICPVETPEGKNTGLVNSLTAYARVNSDGYIETPFYRVYKGQVQKKTGLFFFSAKQEEKIKLGAADLYTTDIGFLPLASIPVRIVEDFTKISRNAIQYVGVAPIQMISIATSLIPFFEHDDGNRALMGSNMQRQAVPIMKAQRPIVGTGLEARAVSDSGHVLQAKHSGVVTYVSSNKISIYCLE